MDSLTSGIVVDRVTAGQFGISVTSHQAGTLLRKHDHEAASLQLVLSGGFVETSGRHQFDCAAGSLIYKPAGAHHADRYGTAEVTAILIEVPPAAEIAPARVLHKRRPSLEKNARDCIRRRFLHQTGWTLDIEEWALALLSAFEVSSMTPERMRPRWIDDAADLAREGASLATIARGVGRHPTHVARAFRAAFGSSVGDFIRRDRLMTAARWLRATDRPLGQIALICGFYDQSHFTRAFRARFHLTPSAYRLARTKQDS